MHLYGKRSGDLLLPRASLPQVFLLLPRVSLPLLRRSLWELLILHLLGSSTSSVRTARRSMAYRRSGIFCSSLCPMGVAPSSSAYKKAAEK
ncbi:hypothetical protein L3X38_024916 [Prunus dulcis]|uniref:Uncharacterized protein n=1 Tax=Prunus dulcis TaxID=3755 RepID=A0AAD4W1T2_PRUDU|nr:hypothetical protein L3X38_024916 [Prunus dulcis]